MGSAPEVFRPVKGGWGLRGATSVSLRAATARTLRPALVTAWRNLAPAATAARPRKTRTAAARKRKR